MDQFSLHLLGRFTVHHGDRLVDVPPACQRLIALKRRPVHHLWGCADAPLTVNPQYLQLSPDVSVDWHRSDLLDKWAERWVTQDRDRYRAARVSAIETLGHTHEKHLPHHGRSASWPGHARQPMTCSETTEPSSS